VEFNTLPAAWRVAHSPLVAAPTPSPNLVTIVPAPHPADLTLAPQKPVGDEGGAARIAIVLILMCGLLAPLRAQEIGEKQLRDGLKNPARWLTYSGDYAGHRHSPLTQITPANAGKLAAAWTFQTGLSGHKFEATPLVIDGVLYVAGPLNTAWAIDGRTGRELWRYQRALPPVNELRVCCGMVNRGLAVLGDRLFMNTLDAHLVALDRATGNVVWDVELADPRRGYASTGAPLVVGNRIIVGVAGGEYGIRGFLDAYDARDGRRLWRFWTVPAPGEKGSDTWPAEVWQRGGGPTWITGSYDPELNLIYWGTGNPSPDFYGGDRKGDNLYTNALIALDAETGALRWHFQFTPHDEHDWDANHIPVLADVTIDGRARKVVMVANRNGFFYILDRTNGSFVRAFPFVRQTWAQRIDAQGRPIEAPNQRPSPEGTLTCPDLYGGTNFMSPSYDATARLFFVTAREGCMMYIAAAVKQAAGEYSMGGSSRAGPEPATSALRAIDPFTGDRKWELQHGGLSWAGVLSTAGGVVFTGDGRGDFLAADARTGGELWRAPVGARIYAAPITYAIDGRQYVAIAAGSTLTAFALPRD
jgi:alcohol dehydrogenase (cytochrome c)